MTVQKTVLGLVGSPNRDGRTNELVRAALEGAERAGAAIELVQMADHLVDPCRDCLPWVCHKNLKCTYRDQGYELLSEKILNCDALIMGTPVYWWDTSAMVKFLILKMFRIYGWSAPLKGIPALGIGIAGGTGNGLVSGLRPVYHFFQVMQVRALEPLPATRFNFTESKRRAEELGGQLADLANERQPFSGREELLLWYDALPYLNLTRVEERRLLAALTTVALPSDTDAAIPMGLARADALAAAGRPLESMVEITRVYESGYKIFEK